jgi:hypothetical protein
MPANWGYVIAAYGIAVAARPRTAAKTRAA